MQMAQDILSDGDWPSRFRCLLQNSTTIAQQLVDFYFGSLKNLDNA